MPAPKSVSLGYATDTDTVKCRLQLMMALYNLLLRIGKPLPPAQMLVSFYVALWNSLKGSVDDYSKSLAHCLGKWGPISPLCVVWILFFTLLHYNGWRLFGQVQSKDYVYSDRCDTFKKFQKAREQLGGPFKDYLMDVFDSIDLSLELQNISQLGPPQSLSQLTLRPGPINPRRRAS